MKKLKSKRTGIIGELLITDKYYAVSIGSGTSHTETAIYTSLDKLNEDWEDAPEEPKVGYIIDPMEEDYMSADDSGYEESDVERAKELGIWFETKEEAEKAVDKLRAWKVLKDMGFKIAGIRYRNNKNYVEWSIPQKVRDDYYAVSVFNEALHLLFGGEE